MVTVSYTEGDVTVTAEQPVTVKTPVSLEITVPPEKTEYQSGESFDPAGMVVTVYYSDGTSEETVDYTLSPSGKLASTDSAVMVSYTEGEATVTAEQAVTVKAKDKENPFSDVGSGDYYYDAVIWAYYAKPQVTNGMDETHFGPDRTVTRGQAVTFLWRAMGEPEPEAKTNIFRDVEEGSYYCDAVLWACENGITDGTRTFDDGTKNFSPGSSVTRGQMITFLWRTMGEPGKTGQGAWYEDPENWARAQKLLDGTAKAYKTGGECPRADVVYYLWEVLK
jgi:hypothetical protein